MPRELTVNRRRNGDSCRRPSIDVTKIKRESLQAMCDGMTEPDTAILDIAIDLLIL